MMRFDLWMLLIALVASAGASMWSNERKVDAINAINALTAEVATLNDLISE